MSRAFGNGGVAFKRKIGRCHAHSVLPALALLETLELNDVVVEDSGCDVPFA